MGMVKVGSSRNLSKYFSLCRKKSVQNKKAPCHK
jgi:hypothetical protein